MDIVFSTMDRKEVLNLPIIPENLEISFPHHNETFSTINHGDVLLFGKPGLKSISFTSWFPNDERSYPFAKSNVKAKEGKEFFVRNKRLNKPIRIVITHQNGWTVHNELYAIDAFTFGFDRAGDTTYSLDLKQFVEKKVT